MGLDLQYTCGDAKWSCRFSLSDWHTIEELTKHLLDAVKVCFDTDEAGIGMAVNAAALKASARALEVFLDDNKHLLPPTYKFSMEYLLTPEHPVPRKYSAGGISFPMVGDTDHFYALDCGVGRCRIRRIRNSDHQVVEDRDLRDVPDIAKVEINSNGFGKILLKKSMSQADLRKKLREIVQFAEKASSPDIVKIVG